MKKKGIKGYPVWLADFADKRMMVSQKGERGTLEIEISEMILR